MGERFLNILALIVIFAGVVALIRSRRFVPAVNAGANFFVRSIHAETGR